MVAPPTSIFRCTLWSCICMWFVSIPIQSMCCRAYCNVPIKSSLPMLVASPFGLGGARSKMSGF